MKNILRSERICELYSKIYSYDKESSDGLCMHASYAIEKISAYVKNVMDQCITIKYNRGFQKKYLENTGEKIGVEFQCKFKETINYVLSQILANSFDACKEKQSKPGIIAIKVLYNKDKQILTLRVRDNGVGKNSQYSNNKNQSHIPLIGGYGIGQDTIQQFHFITKYDRYLGNEGSIVQIEIDLNKLDNYRGKNINIQNRFT